MSAKTLADQVEWTPEGNGSGYVCARGSAFGYRIDIQVSPTGERWVVDALNIGWTGSSGSHDEAREDALASLAEALILNAFRSDS